MGKVIDRVAHDQYIQDLAIYATATNLSRALPDWRDGLKPGGRRIIYALVHDEKAIGKRLVKSAAVTGTIMKKYHPHGDSGVYNTFKTLINPFEAKVPLMTGQGNFGTIGSDPPAAQRYTECSINEFGMECVIGALADSKEVTSWNPTYDGTSEEPVYLPVRVPLLLINGILGGIGTGIKGDLPTHNLSEVIDATVALIDNPDADIVLIPDHCLPCDIVDTDWKSICDTGYGIYKARATIEQSMDKKDCPVLTITSLPYYGTTAVENSIKDGIASGKFPQIINVDDLSQDNNVKIVITLKKGSDANFVKESLFKYTGCERSCRVNFEVVNGVELTRFSYKEYLTMFIHFMVSNKIREYSARLNKVATRSHRLEAFVKIVGSPDIDKIINLIKNKGTGTDAELVELLIKKYKLTDIQAEYILNAAIKQLSKSCFMRYSEEFKQLLEEDKWLEDRISNVNIIFQDVRQELLNIKAKYGTPRICKVIKATDVNSIPEGTFNVIITENNYIRKIDEFETSVAVKGDNIKHINVVSNTDSLLLFDSRGRVFKLPVHKVPIVAKNDPGIDIKSMVKGLTADIVNMIQESKIKAIVDDRKAVVYLAVLSKNNTIKKLDIEDFLNVPPSGIIYSKPSPDNEIVYVQFITDDVDIVIYSKNKVLRISGADIPLYKRNAAGVGAMNTKGDIEKMNFLFGDSEYVVIVTVNGMVNKFNSSGLVRSQRNKAGSSVIKLANGDSIYAVYGCSDRDIIRISTGAEIIDVPVSSIKIGSSVSKGEKVISTRSNSIISTELHRG